MDMAEVAERLKDLEAETRRCFVEKLAQVRA
jgi:hypothetical protein